MLETRPCVRGGAACAGNRKVGARSAAVGRFRFAGLFSRLEGRWTLFVLADVGDAVGGGMRDVALAADVVEEVLVEELL